MDSQSSILKGPSQRRSEMRSFTRKASELYGAEIYMINSAIELNNPRGAKLMALDPYFMKTNEEYVKSGESVSLCLSHGFESLARELVDAGYGVKEDILILAIKTKNVAGINSIISGNFYPSGGFELEYWYLLHKNFISQAENLKNKEPEIQRLGINESDYQNDEEVLAIALQRAL